MWGFIAGVSLGIWIGMLIMALYTGHRLRRRTP